MDRFFWLVLGFCLCGIGVGVCCLVWVSVHWLFVLFVVLLCVSVFLFFCFLLFVFSL